MAVKPIQSSTIENRQNAKRDVAFGANPVITLMDAIDRGGFAASFITQDFLGMAAPRVGTGMYRNHDKTGELNWDFAKKEGIREILSGPSAFMIPAAMMWVIKKVSGSANNVPIDFINGLGETFINYAKSNKKTLGNKTKTKLEFYEEVFKNILSTSTNKILAGEELEKTAKGFAARLIEIEDAPGKGFIKNLRGIPVEGSAQDLKQSLLEDFVVLKKKFMGSESDKVLAEYTTAGDKKIATSFKSILTHMKDYSEDAIKHVNENLKTGKDIDIEKFVKNLGQRRSGTRFLSNMSMFFAVVSFYILIPKLYNMATKGRDPGLDGLGVKQEITIKNAHPSFGNPEYENSQKPDGAQPAFTGLQSSMSKLGKKVIDSSSLKKFSDNFEFDGASMSVKAMLSLLFGFCLPARLLNAQSSTDRKEILVRDITSFIAILFGAKTINKICSDVFAKQSGLALNIKPANHNESLLKKVYHYAYPTGGVQVLDSDRIIAMYSDVAKYKNGLIDMFESVKNNGGNVGKMLNIDADIKAAATEILGKVPDKNMKYADIVSKFENAKDTIAYKKIVDILANKSNKLVQRAKTLNSSFGFASTIFLVPALMIWIARHCEKMTKKHVEEQKAVSMRNMAKHTQIPEAIRVVTNKPTMAGFLNNA